MIPQATTVDYALVQLIDYQPTLTTLIKFSNSETLSSSYKTTSNIAINVSDDENLELNLNKKSISIVMKITNISKNIPRIDIDEFEELEE